MTHHVCLYNFTRSFNVPPLSVPPAIDPSTSRGDRVGRLVLLVASRRRLRLHRLLLSPVIHSDGEGAGVDSHRLRRVVGLVDAHEPVRELEHVVTERDDHELRILGPFLDVVTHDGDILKVQRRVDLVHDVERRGLVVVKRKDERER